MASIAPDGRVVCRSCGQENPPDSSFCGSCGGSLESGLPKPGEVIAGRYRIVAPIGRGAMGTVYRAEHVQISKVVAIKLLHRELQEHPENVKRFHREAESASRLNHPNTVHVFDFGRTETGLMYIVMEHVDGADLGKALDDEGPMAFGRVAYLLAQVAGSVADAHESGIVHRDLKPENIVVAQGRDGEIAKVLDFGLAKLFESAPELQVTGAGTIVGTPHYMSPEQVQGHELDGRSDVYAMGAIMYECVVGKPPFEAPNPVAVLSKHLTEQPLPPSARSPLSVPPEADAIIMRCLQKDREGRFSSAEALRLGLIEYLTSVGVEHWRTTGLGMRPPGSGSRPVDSLFAPKRKGWLAFALLSLLVFGVGVWKFVTRGPSEREPNHTPSEANRLAEGRELQGYLGKRLDPETGDIDVFAIENEGNETRPVSISVSAIPNMDLVLEVFEREGVEPDFVGDAEGLGKGEHLPNVPLDPGTHFIRVREREDQERLPTENVSDPYYVRWDGSDGAPGFEREDNGSLELAESLPLGTERRAWIGWAGDVDTFCLADDADAVIAQVSALEGVDVVLRVVDARSERSAKIDDNGVGRGETSKPWRNVEAGALCVEVSAGPRTERSRSAAVDSTYGVRFIEAPKL